MHWSQEKWTGRLLGVALVGAISTGAGAGVVYATGFEPPVYGMGVLGGQDG